MNTIEEKYFSILDAHFGDLFKFMARPDYKQEMLYERVSKIFSRPMIEAELDSLLYDLKKLDWESQKRAVYNTPGMHAFYAGSQNSCINTPEQTFGFLKKMSLYADTIVINDPVGAELAIGKYTPNVVNYCLLLESANHIYTIRDLFLSDSQPSICSLVPSKYITSNKGIDDKTDNEFYEKYISLPLAASVVKKSFPSESKLRIYLNQFQTFKQFIAVNNTSQYPLADEFGEALTEESCLRLKSAYEIYSGKVLSVPELIFKMIRCRNANAFDDLLANSELSFKTITDLKGVWYDLVSLMKVDNHKILNRNQNFPSKDELILDLLGKVKYKWLGNIPLDRIKQMRERGELQEMRDLIGSNVNELYNAEDKDFLEVGRQVNYNIDQALKKHNAEVHDLNEKYKRQYSIAGASLAVSGSIAISSVLFPPFALAASIVSSIVGGGTLLDIGKNYLSKREEFDAMQKKPVAILFDAYKSS